MQLLQRFRGCRKYSVIFFPKPYSASPNSRCGVHSSCWLFVGAHCFEGCSVVAQMLQLSCCAIAQMLHAEAILMILIIYKIIYVMPHRAANSNHQGSVRNNILRSVKTRHGQYRRQKPIFWYTITIRKWRQSMHETRG